MVLSIFITSKITSLSLFFSHVIATIFFLSIPWFTEQESTFPWAYEKLFQEETGFFVTLQQETQLALLLKKGHLQCFSFFSLNTTCSVFFVLHIFLPQWTNIKLKITGRIIKGEGTLEAKWCRVSQPFDARGSKNSTNCSDPAMLWKLRRNAVLSFKNFLVDMMLRHHGLPLNWTRSLAVRNKELFPVVINKKEKRYFIITLFEHYQEVTSCNKVFSNKHFDAIDLNNPTNCSNHAMLWKFHTNAALWFKHSLM